VLGGGGRLGFAAAMAVTVYEKRTCTTCRRLHELLTERGIDFDTVQYHVEGLTEPELLQRPIVVNGERAVLARPVERVLEIL
jgi:arsenate reductase-like glutaredoxin family protein